MTPALQFLIADERPLAELEERLKALLSLQFEPEERVERRYYDSFDWRLYHRDLSLEAVFAGERTQLRLFDLLDDSTRATLEVTGEPPRFAWDYPKGALRDNLEPMLQVRALLPVVTILARARRMRVLNRDDKTVVRLMVEEARFRAPQGGAEGALGRYLRLIPVRGYDKAMQRTRKLLEKELGIEPLMEHPMLRAVELSGQRVGEYSTKLDFKLSPKRRADLVAKEIHLHLLRVLEANIEGAKADLDTEFLHDLRVATRRIRSALTQIKGVFEPDIVAHFKAEFAWIQEITGPTRDMDVYLLKFDDYRGSLPAWVRPDLTPFHAFLLERRAEAQRRLVTALESARFRRIIDEWRGYCEAPVPERSHLPNAIRPIHWVASERIWRMYRRVMKEGRAIDQNAPAEALHELRKSCKKLRYLMEFFQGLYPRRAFRRLLKSVKILLDNLGDFQDFEVQAHTLRGFAEQMFEENKADADTLIAMGILVGDLLDGQTQARAAFEERFGRFAEKANRRQFKRLFKPSGRES